MSLKRLTGWGPLASLPAAVIYALTPQWPRWAFMWSLAFAIYAGFKWLTWRRTPVTGVSWRRRFGYLAAWPGMDAFAFLGPTTAARPEPKEWLSAFAKLVIGVVLLFGVARLVPHGASYLAGWIGMIGLVMILHFGAFHLLSCAWRSYGVDAKPVMNRPVVSKSVGEFWGRRWNTAFRDLTFRFLFRPLTARLGPRFAAVAGFSVSGLIHDLVISFPARGGYGGPTAFFLLQGMALLIERSSVGRRSGLGRGWRGWLFAAAALALPACLLFHPPFVREVVQPFMRAIGAY
ncbi:MAG: MBOAT family protein [Planctomycetota bacterium]